MLKGSTQFTKPERILHGVMKTIGYASLFAVGSVVVMGCTVAALHFKHDKRNEHGNQR